MQREREWLLNAARRILELTYGPELLRADSEHSIVDPRTSTRIIEIGIGPLSVAIITAFYERRTVITTL